MRKKFEAWILKEEFNQDTFQSFVCWMLFGGTAFSLITPAVLILTQIARPQTSCDEGTFTVLAHYRLHEWLYEAFEEFKNESIVGDDAKKCFELVISDSQYDSDHDPTVWIPENTMWIDVGEDDEGTLIKRNPNKNCTSLANIPMGLVTWKSYADALDLDSNLMNYSDFLLLASMGWSNYTGGSIDVNSFKFSHAHPNVTSSGLLGMVLGYYGADGSLNESMAFSFDDEDDDDVETIIKHVEHKVYQLGPNELAGITNFLGHGPDYIHAMYGYENDVAYNNYIYNDYLTNFWNDSLSFIYFEETFWMEHPYCILDTDDTDLISIGVSFLAFLQERLEDLLDYGIRPYDVSWDSSNVLNTTYGVYPQDVTKDESSALEFPDADTVTDLQEKWLDLKVPVYLRLLLEVSSEMQETTTGTNTIWLDAIDGLPYFARYMEDDAYYTASCFASQLYDCSASETWPTNGTLGDHRDKIIEILSSKMTVTNADGEVALYNAINTTLIEMRDLKSNISDAYNFVLIIISSPNSVSSTESITSDELLEIVGVNYEQDDIHIYPIYFSSDDTDETKRVLEDIAVRTNGVYSSTTTEMPDTLKAIGWYF